ncbi:hypothetical protein T02_5723 [Trichinella nativa]|uniref:Uncharacterized protein n=1 Tax=Trichinella nativa TaxID=6335 RepID=A0A0V1KPH0_9BILA|nr:hypothetical protein T02_5723 [Trichinella nativa]
MTVQPREIYRDLAFSVTQMLATHRDAAGKQLVVSGKVAMKIYRDFIVIKIVTCIAGELKGEVKSQYSIEYLSVPFIYLSNFSPISSTGELCALVPYWRTFIGEDNIAGLICPEDGDVGERPMLGLRLGKPSICERLVPVINATGLPRGEL